MLKNFARDSFATAFACARYVLVLATQTTQHQYVTYQHCLAVSRWAKEEKSPSRRPQSGEQLQCRDIIIWMEKTYISGIQLR